MSSHAGVSAQQQNGAEQGCQAGGNIKSSRHQSRSFLKRNARANSRTEGEVLECIMVEIRTKSRRYAESTNRIISSFSSELGLYENFMGGPADFAINCRRTKSASKLSTFSSGI